MSGKYSLIEINDIFDDLIDENKRLKDELIYTNKYINILSKFKLIVDQNCLILESNPELKSLYQEFNGFIIEKQFNENEVKVFETKTRNPIMSEELKPIDMKSKEIKIKTGTKLNGINNKINTKAKAYRILTKSIKNKYYKYECDIPECNYKAKRPQVLIDHKNSHLGLRPYQCTEINCNKTFGMKRNLSKHFSVCHNDDKPIKCEECGSRMLSKKRLVIHMRKHTGEKPFVCEWAECDYKTTQLVNLQHHQNSKHTGNRPYKCTFDGCYADFVYPGSLHSHINSVHKELNKFVCEWPGCGAIHKHKKSFIAHKLSHTDSKPYTCDWPGCDYGTRRPELLRNHKFTHTGERNYWCSWPACEKRFKTQKALREHLMIHNDDKRYACKWPGCEYRCVSSGNIVKHNNIHHKKLNK